MTLVCSNEYGSISYTDNGYVVKRRVNKFSASIYNEATILEVLNGLHAPKIISIEARQSHTELVMTYLKGNQCPWQITTKEALRLFLIQTIESLNRIHANGIIHGDIKPEHIINGNNDIYFIDFECGFHPNCSYTNIIGYSPLYRRPHRLKHLESSIDDDWFALFCSMLSTIRNVVPYETNFLDIDQNCRVSHFLKSQIRQYLSKISYRFIPEVCLINLR
jgi:serine/threonine protein kinase